MCRAALLGGGMVCVSACTSPSDCASPFFCEAPTPGSGSGYCVPPSASHCAGCTADADCGPLSDSCSTGPGDGAPACHVDCALGGTAACPLDYTCTSVTVNGASRALCEPNVGVCASAAGGFCDRVPGPLSCTRGTSDGTCTGSRTCSSSTGRFGSCSAATPTCKPTCTSPDDPGCTENLCAGATTGPDACGSCSNPCPGYGLATDVVTCQSGSTCTFACAGANYDSNDSTADGCEAADPVDDHSQSTATELGNSDCYDGDGIPPNGAGPRGAMASDRRTHSPAINGFASGTGSAPDWFHTFNTGGTCYDDFSVTLTVSGTANPTCYRLTVKTTKGTWQQNTASNGATTISAGSGSYSDNSDIYFVVDKVCTTQQIESVTYAITGHL